MLQPNVLKRPSLSATRIDTHHGQFHNNKDANRLFWCELVRAASMQISQNVAQTRGHILEIARKTMQKCWQRVKKNMQNSVWVAKI